MQLVFQNDKDGNKNFYFLEWFNFSILCRNIISQDHQFNFLPSLDIVWQTRTGVSFAIRFTWLFFRIGLMF